MQNPKKNNTKHTYRFCVQFESRFVVFLYIFSISFSFFCISLRKTATEKYTKENLPDKNVVARYREINMILLVQFGFLIYIHLLFLHFFMTIHDFIFCVKILFLGRVLDIRHVTLQLLVPDSQHVRNCAIKMSYENEKIWWRTQNKTNNLKLDAFKELRCVFQWDNTNNIFHVLYNSWQFY